MGGAVEGESSGHADEAEAVEGGEDSNRPLRRKIQKNVVEMPVALCTFSNC